MDKQDISGLYKWLRARLDEKGYAEIGPVRPLDLAFFKTKALGLPSIIAVIDTGHIANTPTEIFQQVEDWFQKLIGKGSGALLFVFRSPPPITTIEEIQKIGGPVVAGAHDLHTGRHWLSNYMGLEQEIYDT